MMCHRTSWIFNAGSINENLNPIFIYLRCMRSLPPSKPHVSILIWADRAAGDIWHWLVSGPRYFMKTPASKKCADHRPALITVISLEAGFQLEFFFILLTWLSAVVKWRSKLMISSSNYLRSNEQSFLPLNKYGLSDDGPGMSRWSHCETFLQHNSQPQKQRDYSVLSSVKHNERARGRERSTKYWDVRRS